MKSVKILQLKYDTDDTFRKAFLSYSTATKQYGRINLDDYECVYDGEIPDHYSPEDVYELCNLNHPEGYKGHSLSVSDVIVMDGKNLYVDGFGFVEL